MEEIIPLLEKRHELGIIVSEMSGAIMNSKGNFSLRVKKKRKQPGKG